MLKRWSLVDSQEAVNLCTPRSAMFMMFTMFRSSDRRWLEPLLFREALAAVVSVLAGLRRPDDSGNFKQCEWSRS